MGPAPRWKTALQAGLVMLPLVFLGFFLPIVFPVKGPAAMAALRPRYGPLGVYRWEDGQNHALPHRFRARHTQI